MSKNSEAISNSYGCWVFSDSVMRERLPKNVYKSIRATIDSGEKLDLKSADIIASEMKNWALELGATHYTHWFQPMTGATAEKHDSFISPTKGGRIMYEFTGKELVQGEPDGSSFPTGGIRETFEARGYTAWDCTSPAFVKSDGTNKSLFIPSVFCSYTGEALDKKTPLLRSMDAVNTAALKVLKLLGHNATKKVTASLGSEQEYFLIDEKYADQRMDLRLSGRTLFGAPSPKGQEMDDHYFGTLDERVASFMSELNNELWTLGITAKTQHNEVSPAQYEIAPIFSTVNISTDHNHLTMEALKKVAKRHGFLCSLHEKPFAELNGSGKHNNWSLGTDDGINLFDPGHNPHENIIFLTFLVATIRAVDKYQDLLRASVANPGNDHRLGANEAPPAIISIFLGDTLTDIITQLENKELKSSIKGGEMTLGATTLPPLAKDNTDRNRTSPFAFTGNRFEFRMASSSQSPSAPNFVLNTIVADALDDIAGELEGSNDMPAQLMDLLSRYVKEHKRIVFNGNGYGEEWLVEAEKRGLSNLKNTPDALVASVDKANIELLEKHKVLSEREALSRFEVYNEHYINSINIEAQCTLRMGSTLILPAVLKYSGELAKAANEVKASGVNASAQTSQLGKVSDLAAALEKNLATLDEAINASADIDDASDKAKAYRDAVIPAMNAVREAADSLEVIVDAAAWPLPSYAEMLFNR